MTDKRVEQFQKAYDARKTIMPKTAREMLEAYYELEAEFERLRIRVSGYTPNRSVGQPLPPRGHSGVVKVKEASNER